MEVEGARLVPPPDVTRCAGAHSVCDIQLSQVSPHSFAPLGPVCTMFRSDSQEACCLAPFFSPCRFSHLALFIPLSVDFSKPVSSAFQSHSSPFAAQSGGRAQVVLSWWDLDMDPSGSIVCSMAPSWTYPEPKMAPVSSSTPCSDALSPAPIHPLMAAVVCFSGGTTGCRACTSCHRRAG